MPAVSETISILPPGQVRLPALAIGALSILLAMGLEVLGLLARMNAWIAMGVSGSGGLTKDLSEWWVWLGTIVFAFGISFSMLGVAGTWRRIVLWVSAIVIVCCWAPVLALASREPEIASPLVAVAWSGFCALVYTSRHRMAGDDPIPES